MCDTEVFLSWTVRYRTLVWTGSERVEAGVIEANFEKTAVHITATRGSSVPVQRGQLCLVVQGLMGEQLISALKSLHMTR